VIRFLFKSAFFLTLIFVAIAFLTPHPDQNNQDETAGSYSALDALFVVRNTMADLGNFCERNPETCETGKSFFGSLGAKARDGARITYEFLDAKFGSASQSPSSGAKTGHTGHTPSSQPDQPLPQASSNQKKHAQW